MYVLTVLTTVEVAAVIGNCFSCTIFISLTVPNYRISLWLEYVAMERWQGKVAIVTGASSGIGAATAKRLVEEGMVVLGLARRVERMKELADQLSGKKGRLHYVKCDISREEDILNAFKYAKANLGPIHVLINNAGIGSTSSLSDGDTDSWRQILDVNVLGLCIGTREAIRDMKANHVDGHIVHINSIMGHNVFPQFPSSVYQAAKFAVTALAETLRQEFNTLESKIKITSVSPGIVLTEIFQNSGVSAEPLKTAAGNLPCLKSEDVADAIAYVLSTPPHVQITELTIKPLNEVV